MAEIPEDIRNLLESVTGKRAKIVIQHILEHGAVTTEELETIYGYKHPPRAARDVREHGIPLETFSTKDAEGKTIAAYRFGDLSRIQTHKLGGRKVFPKSLKTKLLSLQENRCAICMASYDDQFLQIDHRIPYEVAGDVSTNYPVEDYMLVCRSCNRAKSWACEHCDNWLKQQDKAVCRTCYWANPTDYTHIAMKEIRRIALIWTQDEIANFERLQREAAKAQMSLHDYIKSHLKS